MKQLSLLLKPASGLCNLRCRYCFYEDECRMRQVPSFGKMRMETARGIIDRAVEAADEISFLFQGGEPTLAGLDFFRSFAEEADRRVRESGRRITLHYAIQTNGTLLDEDWCAFLKERHFLVGLSLDGSAEFHDRSRVDAAGNGTFRRVWQAKLLLDRFGVDYNIVWVLTNSQARFPRKVWNFIVREDLRYVQFIPCLGPLDGSRSPWALTPERFCSFYTELYALWDRDLQAGKYRSIKFFDDLFNLLLRGQVTACGFTGQCQMQFVVEADGSVYPCDFYVLDEWKCGSFPENSVEELQRSAAAKHFLCRDHALPALCRTCRWRRFCGGGCVRERSSMYVNDRGNFCGYGEFLTRSEQALNRTAAFLDRSSRR